MLLFFCSVFPMGVQRFGGSQLGPQRYHHSRPWDLLGASWAPLGTLEVLLVLLGCSWAYLGALLGTLGRLWASFWGLLGSSWSLLGPLGGLVEAPWALFQAILGLGLSWGSRETLWGLPWALVSL